MLDRCRRPVIFLLGIGLIVAVYGAGWTRQGHPAKELKNKVFALYLEQHPEGRASAVYYWDGSIAQPKALTGSELWVDAAWYSPLGQRVVFRARQKVKEGDKEFYSNETSALYFMDVGNPVAKKLTGLEGRSKNIHFLNEEKFLVFEYFGATSKTQRNVCMYDLKQEQCTEIDLGFDLTSHRLIQVDGLQDKISFALSGTDQEPYRVILYDMKHGKQAVLWEDPVEDIAGPFDNWIGSMRFSPDGSLLVFTALRPSMETPVKNRASALFLCEGETCHAISAIEEGSGSHIVWSPNGAHIAVQRTGELRILTTKGETLYKIAGYFSALPGWSPDGRYCAIAGRVILDKDVHGKSLDEFGLLLIDCRQKQLRLVGALNSAHTIAPPRFTPDGSKILLPVVRSDGSAGRYAADLYAFDLEGGERPLVLTHNGTFSFAVRRLPGHLLDIFVVTQPSSD